MKKRLQRKTKEKLKEIVEEKKEYLKETIKEVLEEKIKETKKDKIALIVDSCCNVPYDFIKEYNIYVIQTKISYHNRELNDDIGDTAELVLYNLKNETLKTSLPSIDDITNVFDKVKVDGYNKALVITISSGLSGTYNVIRLASENYDDLQIEVIDTKNISIGAGFIAMRAAREIKSGISFNELVIKTQMKLKDSKVFFILDTLEYLKKGGRIGLVTYTLAETLNIKPIISCNDEGVYHTVSKVRGRQKAILKVIEEVKKYGARFNDYTLSVVTSGCNDKDEIIQLVNKEFEGKEIIESGVSGTIVVHTGPGLLGIALIKK